MLEIEKQQFLITHLMESAADFEKAISTADPAHWNARPSPDCWSIAEIAEHVLIIDTAVAGFAATLGEWPEEAYDAADSARKDDMILVVAEDRGTRIDSPPRFHPQGTLKSAEEFYPGFRETHHRLTSAAAGNPDLLRGRFREHPFLKKLDGYQWLLVCSCHRRRHMNQIEEVKTALAV